jgi:hypothetical protein
VTIRLCIPADFDAMLAVINAAATAYDGVIPPDLHHVPFVSAEELRDEIADGAIRFYERHGFRLLTPAEKDRLLRRYWRIPERQVETSAVLRFSPWSPAGASAPRAG